MRFAPEGQREMLLSTLVLVLGVCAAVVWYWPIVVPLMVIWIWSIAFFRDPARVTNLADDELCAPADGRVQDVTYLKHYGPIDGAAVRIGIFLSLFDVHINRSPCAGIVRSVEYRRGKFMTAMNPLAGEVNESNTLVIDRSDLSPGPIIVRQIAGWAARRIVCHAGPGTQLHPGERFGMIKFGSRTELIVPVTADTEVLVKVGDKVRAGLTPVIRQPLIVEQEAPGDAEQHEATSRPATASA